MRLNDNTGTDKGEVPEIHIGKIIHEEVRRQGLSAVWLSEQMGCDRRNIYNIYNRAFIDTYLLMRLSAVLHHDFFRHYSNLLKKTPCSRK